MTKRLIDVDDKKLETVRTLLGTTTLKATVDAALDEVLALDQRRRTLLAKRDVDLAVNWQTLRHVKPRGVSALLLG